MTTYNPAWNDGTWDIPGFTAQNQAYPPQTPSNGTPTVPYAYVYGTFLAAGGAKANGVVTFTPSVRDYVYNGTFTELDPIKIQIINGTVGINIPVGTAGTNPTTWTWDIRLRIGPTTRTFSGITLTSGQTLDLTTLGP